MAKKTPAQGSESQEFASGSAEAPDESRANEKMEKQRESASGPPVVEAKDFKGLNQVVDEEAGEDVGQEEVQQRFDQEQEHGMRGVKMDPTPNENYTVDGVTSGAPTPETDDELRIEARKARTVDGPAPIV